MNKNTQGKPIRRLVGIGLLAALLLFFVYAFMPKPVPVDMATVSRGAMQVEVRDEGYTRVHDVYVVSAPVTAHLLRIEPHVGDAVEAGKTLLARLLPTDPGFLDARSRSQAEAAVRTAQAALTLARAERRKAAAQVEFAQSDARRARQMAEQDSISRADLDRAELALKTAHAALDTARASEQMRAAELENARAVLTPPGKGGTSSEEGVVRLIAPITGRILRRLQESETVVAAGTPLIELGDPADLEIVVDLLSRDAVKVKENAAVAITGWGGANALQGRVRRVEPYGFTKVSALGIEEQRVNVIIDITSERTDWQGLGHGYRVDAAIRIWQADDVLQVPTGALFRQAGDWAVFRVINDEAVLTPVTLGQNNGQVAEVLDGLSKDDTVVLHPSERIEDGIAVEPRSI